MSKWWMQFPKIESRVSRRPPADNHPELEPGTVVRLRGKPEKLRRVLRTQWHRHRYEFVYIIETRAEKFEPYWFRDQLSVEAPVE